MKMKTRLTLLSLLAMGIAMTSCNSDNESSGILKSKNITVATRIGGLTRVTADADGVETFDEGDQISVYAWAGDNTSAPSKSELVVDNAINTLTNGKWVANPQMLWKNNRDDHYFVAIYPHTAVDDLSNGEYFFDFTHQTNNDLLVARNFTGLSYNEDGGNDVPLNFTHVMAKVNVKLQFRNQWGGVPQVDSVVIGTVPTTAKINYITNGIESLDVNGEYLNVPCVQPNVKFSSIVIPNTNALPIANRIHVYIDGKQYSYFHDGKFEFESGKYTTINLIVGRDELKLGDISISNWEKGLDFDGEASDAIMPE